MRPLALILQLALGRRRPVVRGTLRVRGPRDAVTIRRDSWGVPYIEAECDSDAFFALGFCHGQDRSFQLEVQKRAARGTLAEIVGRKALSFDRLSRRVGFHRAATSQIRALEPDLRATVDSYALGVNEGIRVGTRKRAHELAILRTHPTEFHATDVRALLNLLSFVLASNWDSELTRLRVLEHDGKDALLALNPTYPPWLPVASPPGEPAGPMISELAISRLAEDVEALLRVTGSGGASNNWAIAPRRTRTGRPLVANDPHLPPTVPSPWYLATIRTPEWVVSGATFVGSPAFPVGHNEVGAWGITAGLVDNTDLYIEDVAPDGRSVRFGDGYVPCEIVEERIAVRGGDDVVERIVVTPRGPVIGPALPGETRAISLRATWLETRPVRGFLSVHRTTSFESFRDEFREWPVMSASMAYAHRDGTIGWQLMGEAPRRRRGHGLLPSPGWLPDGGWEEDCVPFDDMPRAVSPEEGFVASANQSPTRAGEGPYLGQDWIDGYRMARICERIRERDDWDVEGCLALQIDRLSIPWREIRDEILAAPVGSRDGRRALELLAAWDGTVADDSPAACLFEHLLVELTRRCVVAKAPSSASWMLGQGPGGAVAHRAMLSVRRVGHLSRLLREQPAGWFHRSWPEEIADAIEDTWRRLVERLGRRVERWAWGRVRRLWFQHPFGESRLLRRIFSLGPLPGGGDSNTVAQTAVDPFEPTANPLFVSSLRAVFDVGSWSACRFALPGGQSGNPTSPHYSDQLPLYLRGDGLTLPWTPEEARRATRDELLLEGSGNA